MVLVQVNALHAKQHPPVPDQVRKSVHQKAACPAPTPVPLKLLRFVAGSRIDELDDSPYGHNLLPCAAILLLFQ